MGTVTNLSFARIAAVTDLSQGSGSDTVKFVRQPAMMATARRTGDGMANFIICKAGRGLAMAAVVSTAVLTMAPEPAQADIGTGAAVALGLGAFALGSALAAPYYYGNPYYGYYGNPSYYPPGYGYPPAAYYPPYYGYPYYSGYYPYYRRY
jgi:hypothetical protein